MKYVRMPIERESPEEFGYGRIENNLSENMSYGTPLPTAASISPHAISVSSISKSYGVPGIRVGWVITRDPMLYESLLAGKEQIGICGALRTELAAI